MNVIVPMAGAGKRLRPHTLTTPKPLLPVAGKPIVQWLVEDIVALCGHKVERIGYVTGELNDETQNDLLEVASRMGAAGSLHRQHQPLGTAHAIMCAAELLQGPVIVAFADTLFRADFEMDTTADGVLWVQRIADPRQFGVVVVNQEGVITDFVEKPQQFVSDLAMIGIYYFSRGESLKQEIQQLLDTNHRTGGEYQLPDALRSMLAKGARFKTGEVNDWMDCGNAAAVIDTNRKMLDYRGPMRSNEASLQLTEARIIEPCFIGKGVVIRHSTVGPHVSLGDHCLVEHSAISNSVVNHLTAIRHSHIIDSMIGSHTDIYGLHGSVSLGDYSILKHTD